MTGVSNVEAEQRKTNQGNAARSSENTALDVTSVQPETQPELERQLPPLQEPLPQQLPQEQTQQKQVKREEKQDECECTTETHNLRPRDKKINYKV